MAKEDDDLDAWFNDRTHYSKSQPSTTTKTPAKEGPGILESIGRGGYSGVTMGFSPGADEKAQQEAWDTHPYAYGIGNALGTIGNTLATGSLGAWGKGALAAKQAAAASFPTASTITKALGNVVAPVVEKIGNVLPKSTPNVIQGVTKTGNFIENTPQGGHVPAAVKEKISQSDDEGIGNTLKQYLASAKDEDEKRKMAMELQTTPEGRAVGNTAEA